MPIPLSSKPHFRKGSGQTFRYTITELIFSDIGCDIRDNQYHFS